MSAAVIATLEERVVYENDYVRVFDDRVAFPDGREGSYFRTRWKSPHGVGIVPVLGPDVLLIEAYIYAERSWSIEIPKGFGTAGSAPVDDARRELAEETGLQARTLRPLIAVGHDYVTHIYVATIDAAAQAHADGIERTEAVAGYRRFPVARIGTAALMAEGIRDPLTIAALLAYADEIRSG